MATTVPSLQIDRVLRQEFWIPQERDKERELKGGKRTAALAGPGTRRGREDVHASTAKRDMVRSLNLSEGFGSRLPIAIEEDVQEKPMERRRPERIARSQTSVVIA